MEMAPISSNCWKSVQKLSQHVQSVSHWEAGDHQPWDEAPKVFPPTPTAPQPSGAMYRVLVPPQGSTLVPGHTDV